MEKWGRKVLTFSSETYTGNPFLVEMNVQFTHRQSDQSLMLPAYYDGDNLWRVNFMHTELGGWTWLTVSEDSDLDESSERDSSFS